FLAQSQSSTPLPLSPVSRQSAGERGGLKINLAGLHDEELEVVLAGRLLAEVGENERLARAQSDRRLLPGRDPGHGRGPARPVSAAQGPPSAPRLRAPADRRCMVHGGGPKDRPKSYNFRGDKPRGASYVGRKPHLVDSKGHSGSSPGGSPGRPTGGPPGRPTPDGPDDAPRADDSAIR